MGSIVLYVHGQGGTAEEAGFYRPLFPGRRVVGLDYRAETPWEAEREFPPALRALPEGDGPVILIANSIGAYFSMCALPQERIRRAYFISPVVDMQRLILGMMDRAKVTEGDLRKRGQIKTASGETLSWEYLRYVRSHPIRWGVPTEILYGGRDGLTSRETITTFANAHHAGLTVLEDGEHWFHTAEQMVFLESWLRGSL